MVERWGRGVFVHQRMAVVDWLPGAQDEGKISGAVWADGGCLWLSVVGRGAFVQLHMAAAGWLPGAQEGDGWCGWEKAPLADRECAGKRNGCFLYPFGISARRQAQRCCPRLRAVLCCWVDIMGTVETAEG